MGEARRRGSREERIVQSKEAAKLRQIERARLKAEQARIEAERKAEEDKQRLERGEDVNVTRKRTANKRHRNLMLTTMLAVSGFNYPGLYDSLPSDNKDS